MLTLMFSAATRRHRLGLAACLVVSSIMLVRNETCSESLDLCHGRQAAYAACSPVLHVISKFYIIHFSVGSILHANLHLSQVP
jgi:hypothetical protein